jgi:hypothetical protein
MKYDLRKEPDVSDVPWPSRQLLIDHFIYITNEQISTPPSS